MRTLLLVATLGMLTLMVPTTARATYEGDFFTGSAAHCYFDQRTLTWRIGNDVVERTIHFDREAGALKTLRVEHRKSGPLTVASAGNEGEFIFAADPRTGARPASVRLDSDWRFSWQSFDTPAHRGRKLTIHLMGTGRYQGYEVEAIYEVYPGDRPYLAKSFNLVNHTGAPRTLEEVVYDRWILAPPLVKPSRTAAAPLTLQFKHYVGTSATLINPESRSGLLSGVLHYQGDSVYESGAVVQRVRPGVTLPGNDGHYTGPRAMVAVFTGPPATGAFLYQLYIGAYHALSTPTRIPVLYNTWFGYKDGIDQETCRKIIPLAAQIGAKLFVIDDGWQTNAAGKGRYGDWRVDRKPAKFPDGLAPIAALVRQNGMGFGLWMAPIMVNNDSQVAQQHPEWLIRHADGSTVHPWNKDNSGMCFTDGWANAFTHQFIDYAQQLRLTFFKCDSSLFEDGCVADLHDHPKGHSVFQQMDYWQKFGDRLRLLNSGFILDRGWEEGPEVTNMQETGWFGDWEIGYDPDRMKDARWWYKNADIYRMTLYNLGWVRPPYTINWETPCHIPTDPVDLNALEYHFTSIGAYICNPEWHGRIDQMTAEEKALCRKWTTWNTENRRWLAFTQPILEAPWDPRPANAQPHVDGVMHLRNALYNRYGYICLWNPGEKSDQAVISFRPSDYRIEMNPRTLEIVRLKDGAPMRWSATPSGEIRLEASMVPLSWEIYELRIKGPK